MHGLLVFFPFHPLLLPDKRTSLKLNSDKFQKSFTHLDKFINIPD